MNIIGNIHLIDDAHIDILQRELSTNPPPGGYLATGTLLCMDMDETDDRLEQWFPNHCQKATLLCPPPIAMYKEIDGDEEGFIQAYNDYLDYDPSVQDFVSSMLLFLHIGGNILLYTPSLISDGAIWINTLSMWFFTRYGVTIGTPMSKADYDPKYDGMIADMLYRKGLMNVFDYINSCVNPVPPLDIEEKLCLDLELFCPIGEHPMELYYHMRNSLFNNGIPVIKPAVMFEK